MMVLESESLEMPAQSELFRSIRTHAKEAGDRRPIKSPAESLLNLLKDKSGRSWKKVFEPTAAPVADLLLHTLENLGQPALILISKGMHWVVASGRTLGQDGSVAGILLGDPAWAGMPPFFGISVYPEKTTFTHTSTPCLCLQSDQRPGTVHERYIALAELLSPRGLQGSPDWEGKGAIALVPAEATAAAVITHCSQGSGIGENRASWNTSAEAAMPQALEHGLYGRADSPADWQATLEGGQPGEPILVKSPDDPRDDFYLVPIISQSSKSKHTAWIMLDAETFQLREASLLEHWKTPLFPDREDTQKFSENELTLPDGTRARYRPNEIKANQKNLVWKASAATILPYWPVKEWVVPHPITGEPVSIYQTQEGKIYTHLAAEEPIQQPSEPPTQSAKFGNPWLAACVGILAGAAGGYVIPRLAPPTTNSTVEMNHPAITTKPQKMLAPPETRSAATEKSRIDRLEAENRNHQISIRNLKAQVAKQADALHAVDGAPIHLAEIDELRSQILKLKNSLKSKVIVDPQITSEPITGAEAPPDIEENDDKPPPK